MTDKSSSPSATLSRNEIERFRRGDILLSDEQANRFCDLALSALSETRQMGWARVYKDGRFDVMHGKPRSSDSGDTTTWTVIPLYSAPSVPSARRLIPEGWKLVPLEPTAKMVNASIDAFYDTAGMADVIRAVIAAAPEAP